MAICGLFHYDSLILRIIKQVVGRWTAPHILVTVLLLNFALLACSLGAVKTSSYWPVQSLILSGHLWWAHCCHISSLVWASQQSFEMSRVIISTLQMKKLNLSEVKPPFGNPDPLTSNTYAFSIDNTFENNYTEIWNRNASLYYDSHLHPDATFPGL